MDKILVYGLFVVCILAIVVGLWLLIAWLLMWAYNIGVAGTFGLATIAYWPMVGLMLFVILVAAIIKRFA